MTPPPSGYETRQTPRLVDDEIADRPQLITDADGETTTKAGHDDGKNFTEASQTFEISGPAWQGYFFAMLPVLVCFFGAGREAWSKGIAAALVGLALIIFAPQRRLPPPALVGLLGALLAPLLAFMPASWFSSTTSGWRKSLVADWEIGLSSTLTPQAAVTLEAWCFFMLCGAWLGWCCSRGFSREQRWAMIHTLAIGGLLLCIFSIIEGAGLLNIPWWPRNQLEWGHGFGPFANRNHISSLAAITSVLCAAAAHDAQHRKSHLWLFFSLGIVLPLICLFMNSSRAGLVLFFLGITLWIGTTAMRRGFFQKLAVSTSLVFIIATLLVLSGGNMSKRLTQEGLADFTSLQGRSSIFVESISMFLQAPWLGFGLGNFKAVFPLTTDIQHPLNSHLHPESDLLWFLTEGGLFTVLPGLLLLSWWWWSTGPWFRKKKNSRSGMQDNRLRNAAAIAFGLGLTHGLGDVPNHGMGYALFMALLAGISIRPRRLPKNASTSQRLACRVCGLAAVCLGYAWTAIYLGHPVLAGSSAAESLRTRSASLSQSGSPAAALPLLNAAIRMEPMNYKLYYERACIRLFLGHSPNDALLDFSRARALEPNLANFCYFEGVFWLNFKPDFALISWREALRRWPGHNYWAMLEATRLHPQLREPLWKLADSTEMQMEFLVRVNTREEFDMCLRGLLATQPNLEKFTPAQLEQFFSIWSQQGDQNSLVAALEKKHHWQQHGWRILCEYYARKSDFQGACQTAAAYLPSIRRTTSNSDISSLEQSLLLNPLDARLGIDLFEAQKRQGDIDAALRTLEKLKGNPNAPPYLHQEIAALYMKKQDFRRAWEHFREAMQKR